MFFLCQSTALVMKVQIIHHTTVIHTRTNILIMTVPRTTSSFLVSDPAKAKVAEFKHEYQGSEIKQSDDKPRSKITNSESNVQFPSISSDLLRSTNFGSTISAHFNFYFAL